MIYKVSCNNGSTYSMYLPQYSADHIQKLISTTGRPYEEQLLESVLARTAVGDIIIDIGANIGNHTIFLAHHGRSVIAFEPNLALSRGIAQSVELNSLGDRVEIVNLAIGAKRGHGTMDAANPKNLGMGRVIEGEGNIEIVPLDFHLENRRIAETRHIRAIKIDVEGMEKAVLEGAQSVIRKNKPDLYIEIANKEALAAILSGGYLEGYSFVDSFNYTATHLFVHESRFEGETQFISLADSTVLAIAEMKMEFLSKELRFDQQVGALNSQNRQLEQASADQKRQLEALNSQNRQLEQSSADQKRQLEALNSQNRQLEGRVNKYRARSKKAITWGVLLGAPIILILSPLILIFFFQISE